MTEPSRIHALKERAIGVMKEGMGKLLGKKEMEIEGKMRKEQGHMEMERARTEHKATVDRQRAESSFTAPDCSAVFADICKNDFHLKHVQTNDRSAPMFEKESFKLKKHNIKPLLNEIKRNKVTLKHVDTIDKTNLRFLVEKGSWTFDKKNPRQDLLAAIQRKDAKLRKTKTNDRSAPCLEKKYKKVPLPKTLLKDVTKATPSKLHHVETVDKSCPIIEKDVQIKKCDREPFLGEVKEGVDLKHVETIDKAQPKIPKTFNEGKMMDDKSRRDLDKVQGKKPMNV
jgi:uncharacterized protein YjbJ (UPF0337 family)